MIWPDNSAGPYFDELAVGDRFAGAPGVTLTAGHAAVHQAVLGDRLRLPLDHALATAVAGGPVAHPALVWDVAIGQSTVVTQRVRANLFYRGLAFRRYPLLGDTLRTVTEVVGLKENSRRPDRPPTGLAALRITTVDQDDRPVLDFWRCAMLPLRSAEPTGHHDDLSALGAAAVTGRRRPAGTWPRSGAAAGRALRGPGGGPVVGGRRRGRRVGGAGAGAADRQHRGRAPRRPGRAAPGVRRPHDRPRARAGVPGDPEHRDGRELGGCDHTGPVHEGDRLTSRLSVTGVTPLADGGLVDLRSIVEGPAGPVLDWRFTVVLA